MSTSPETAPTTPALDESLVGRRIHKYEIVRVIGRGGMGMVYEALNTSIGKRVAMKFVDPESARNKEAVARFQREAQAASAVESAHIVEIFDSGFTEDGLPFIVMELLRGEDLGHRIKRCGRLELAEAIHVTAQILRGLHRAHEAGIVHRDLKPDNIFMVDRDDDPNFAKVLDFGISKVQPRGDVPAHTLTRQGTVLGTPFYMSPEQAQALSDVDGRTDLWSVGAILFECLTGRPPHSGGTYEQVIINICMKDVEDVRTHNPGVPEGIAKVIAGALTRERDARFGSARDFLDALVASSGGMISSRTGRSSGDNAVTSRPGMSSSRGARGATPGSSGTPPRTPADSSGAASEYAPTIEVQGNHSKVGWSTSGGAVAKRDRRVYAFVGVGSLAVGAAIAIFMFTGRPVDDKAATPLAAAEAEVQISSNARSARFLVDGSALTNGVLRGSKGEKRKVRVEADGYAPTETEVTIDPAQSPVNIALVAAAVPAPTVDPAGPATEPSVAPSAKAVAKGPKAGGGPKPPANPNPAKTADPVTPPPAPKPKATGVAGGLNIKTE